MNDVLDELDVSAPKESNQEIFNKRLLKSIPAQFEVAKWLFTKRRGNLNISIPRMGLDEADFLDEGDIIVNGEHVVEVKHRHNLNFTCYEDFPFKEKTVIISNVAPTDRKTNTVLWVILNRPMTHAILVSRASQPYWFKDEIWCANWNKYEWLSLIHI